MRVTIADPPAYTPPYDRALAAALARAGVEVELLTSRFRFATPPPADGVTLTDSLYPLSSRLRHDRARLVVKAFEHPLALARLAASRSDVVHLQWVAAPEADTWLLHARRPLVFTAHDILPRRTRARRGAWMRLFARFARVVVHSHGGRRALLDLGVDPEKIRLVRHPVFRGEVEHRDDGRTVLALGVIRPYKRLEDALRATLEVPEARVLVAGDPRVDLGPLQALAGGRAEWRLGYLSEAEVARALAEATVAVFPYAAELDQSGALLQALGSGVPAVVYDVGGLGEVVREFSAGRVVAPGDVDGLQAALRELLDDAGALQAARAGAERARDTLTWEAAAAAHLDLYRELL